VLGGPQAARSRRCGPRYGELFGWAFQDAATGPYLIATLDGRAAAGRLGARVLATSETAWAKEAGLRDPQGAEFTVSEFSPPG
jgi:hypothetical protein